MAQTEWSMSNLGQPRSTQSRQVPDATKLHSPTTLEFMCDVKEIDTVLRSLLRKLSDEEAELKVQINESVTVDERHKSTFRLPVRNIVLYDA